MMVDTKKSTIIIFMKETGAIRIIIHTAFIKIGSGNGF